MAAKHTKDTFMADVGHLLHTRLGKHPQLVIWRGKYPVRDWEPTHKFDAFVVGLADDKESKEPPPIALLTVWIDFGAHYNFDDGSNRSKAASIPFGGGWVPIEEIETEVVPRLEAFSW